MADQHSREASPEVQGTESREAILQILRKLNPFDFMRIADLLIVAEQISKPGALPDLTDRRKETVQDILRAAVVLIHAELEEYLRTIARALLPEGNESCLNEIPLAGLGGRREKFLLGKLVQHKGKFIDDVLRDSVAEHLEHSNYNSTTEIAALLKTLGFDVPKPDGIFPVIQQMIERRHQIVHRADRIEETNLATGPQVIQIEEVGQWLGAVHRLTISLHTALLDKLGKLTGPDHVAKSRLSRRTPQGMVYPAPIARSTPRSAFGPSASIT